MVFLYFYTCFPMGFPDVKHLKRFPLVPWSSHLADATLGASRPLRAPAAEEDITSDWGGWDKWTIDF